MNRKEVVEQGENEYMWGLQMWSTRLWGTGGDAEGMESGPGRDCEMEQNRRTDDRNRK